eukprot:3411638-Rhodomonas_salina.1
MQDTTIRRQDRLYQEFVFSHLGSRYRVSTRSVEVEFSSQITANSPASLLLLVPATYFFPRPRSLLLRVRLAPSFPGLALTCPAHSDAGNHTSTRM